MSTRKDGRACVSLLAPIYSLVPATQARTKVSAQLNLKTVLKLSYFILFFVLLSRLHFLRFDVK